MKKTKAYLNVLKLRLNMKFKREVVQNYPVAAFMEPNLFCNLQCPACPTGLRLDLRPTVSIKEELFKSAVDEIGDYVFQLYMYNWGEPLLHKQTPELIAYAKTKQIKIILSTNLSIKLTDDYIERLVRSGLDTLMVSLDGVTEDVYKKYRRNGNLELVRENVRRIKAMKDKLGSPTPKVVWQFLVFRHNEHQIEEAQAQYKDWGADEISIGPAIMPLEPHNEGFEPSTLPQYNMYHPEHHTQREAQRQLNSGRACSWLYGVFVLNPNGKVSPCCAVPSEKHDFGDYSTETKFLDVWNNDKFQRARRLFVEWGKSAGKKNGNGTAKRDEGELVDGMSVRAALTLADDKLICEKCPIPFLQDYTDPVIVEAANQLADSFARDSLSQKVLHLFQYLLMGAPNWQAIRRRGAGKLGSYFRAS
jgi:MoaA/NifB/PqqE/SkfB family radical SAM enzyme